MSKTESIVGIPSLLGAGMSNNIFYFVWTGMREDVIVWAHSEDGIQALHPLLHTGRTARIWCPNDDDAVVTLQMRNVGTIVSS